MILITSIITILFGFYVFLTIQYKYWKRRGVPGPEPRFFVGNILDNFLVRKSPAELYSDIYKQYKNASMVGIFKATTPILVIRSPELIKELTIKQFKHFHDNELFIDKNVDPLTGRNPFFIRGQEWKSTRAHLTPGFTSGKMKVVYPLLEEISKNFVRYIENHPTATTGEGCQVKEVCMRLTLNNVGSCAFGLDAKCFEEENPEFKQIADGFLTPEGFQNIKVFLVSILPFLTKIFSVRFTPYYIEEKLVNLVTQTLRYREKNNVVRNDFLNILYQLAKNNPNFTEIDVTAHAAGFFADGYETSSIVFHFVLYELASNSEAQEKLRNEINKVFEENDNILPYEELQKMKYLDAAFNEALRLHPPLGSLNKICTEAYTFEPKPGDAVKKSFVIEKNTPCILPLYALQRDPEYFEDPDSFKPERFFNEIKSSTFLPFGEGPRACLGQRFGTLQVKIGIAYIIKHFQVSVNKKTKIPLKYDPVYFLTLPKDPIYLDFKKIN